MPRAAAAPYPVPARRCDALEVWRLLTETTRPKEEKVWEVLYRMKMYEIRRRLEIDWIWIDTRLWPRDAACILLHSTYSQHGGRHSGLPCELLQRLQQLPWTAPGMHCFWWHLFWSVTSQPLFKNLISGTSSHDPVEPLQHLIMKIQQSHQKNW